MTGAFSYPAAAHVRRHGPQGYADASSFRPWLRDEFSFRCVFCLRREQWDRSSSMEIDHFLAATANPHLRCDYDNLLYVCAKCNSAKGAQVVGNPLTTLLASEIEVDAEGRIHARSPSARQLVCDMRLDAHELTSFRRMWLEVLALAQKFDPSLYTRLLAYPSDLPDLAVLRPPGGNTKPEGVNASAFSRRTRGELADTY